jgi:putative oxidoreductase
MTDLQQNAVLLSERTRRITSDAGLLVLRLAAGAIFVAHGWADVTQEGGAGANIPLYREVGIPLAEVSAWFGGYMQLIGGGLLVLGVLTRVAAAGLVAVMGGALVFVHAGEQIVLAPDGSGSGFALAMFAIALCLLGAGPGRLSLDHVLLARFGRRD